MQGVQGVQYRMDISLNTAHPTAPGCAVGCAEGVQSIIRRFQERGILFSLAGESLSFDAPAGALTDADIDLLRTHKPAIMAALQQGQHPPAPADHVQDLLCRIRETWPRFRREHGPRLAALGWDRESLLGGTDPMAATTIDDLDGLPVMLADGAVLAFADETRLDLQRADGSTATRTKSGVWLAESARDAWINGVVCPA